MANVYAVKSGNWSDTTVWNTGALPTSADDVYSNNFTVTVDISPTVLSVRNTSGTGITAGGGFAVSATGLTLTANVQAASATCLTVNVGAGSTFNIVGNCSAGFSNTPPAVVFNSGGTLNVTGNCNGGSSTSNNGFGVSNTSSGTVNITGVCTGGTASNSHAVNNSSTGTVNITGTCTSGSVAGTNYAVNNSSTGTITITGAMQASGSVAVNSGNAGALVILSGPFFVSANGTHAVLCPNWKWANSNLASTYYQIRTANQSTIRPLYTADSIGGNPSVGDVRNGVTYGPSNELTGTLAAVITAADIRAAVGLASANLDTQLAAIPTTAAPTAVAIRTELDTNSTKLANLDATVSSRSTYAGADTSGTTTLLNRLTSGRASALDNLDATISSRLADSSYQAPLDAAGTRSAIGLTSANLDNQLDALPTAVENAQAVRTELTTELNNLDAAVSTRSTFNPGTDTVANVTLVDTTTNLTNPPDVPTTTEIAEAVANELDPTLTTIDSNVLSRLAAADYTEPPTAEQNAGAVRTELTAELGNLDAAVSTRSTFNPATDTVANVTTVNTLTNSPDVPSESEIADAVRAELTPELERVANCATVETTGDQLAALNP